MIIPANRFGAPVDDSAAEVTGGTDASDETETLGLGVGVETATL